MKILGIIPARHGSSRFPAKALADIGGKTMVRRVYEQALKAAKLTDVVVATDHDDIYNEIIKHGGKAVMTRQDHESGTDRCFEALKKQDLQYDYVINIQGDEPFIDPEQINLIAEMLDGQTELGTLIKLIDTKEDLFNPNVVKVIFDINQKAIYFSRSPLPHNRQYPTDEWLKHHAYFRHIGIYAYRTDILEEITKLNVSSLEKSESLEQLRWIENGYSIKVAETEHDSIGIDTPEDLDKLQPFLK
ncbi:3-deoxy-manno-octulosonate cytidylyltransferase [Fulvivirga sediminis]|uniref:3-deoxy-manno-octulosonate cytidylyltransferase n=1 Tax=Fulvivirga sediminis TaxID=2803949 RepID=A0A937K0E1_9BACT|nr:3-deoxy-manno-octulosonate cytidylyltransferase [Fulvivirga sediminis]MBL3656215.1 3-deoxy-manno-octulosonate cytidylyltransferase [Fulvivirga sediminis]